MLFVQKITIRWQKDARNAKCANIRHAVRFKPLPEGETSGEVLLHDVFMGQDAGAIWQNFDKIRCFGEEAFYGGGFNQSPFSGRLAVTKEGNLYRIGYCDKRSLGFFTTRMLLRPGEYGRVVYNERGAYDYTGIWYYDLTTWNFVSAAPDARREKLFFRKTPDRLYEDMQWLRYSG